MKTDINGFMEPENWTDRAFLALEDFTCERGGAGRWSRNEERRWERMNNYLGWRENGRRPYLVGTSTESHMGGYPE